MDFLSGGTGGNQAEVHALIGVVMAITGNFLISVALNLQKYAHNQIKRRAIEFTDYPVREGGSSPEDSADAECFEAESTAMTFHPTSTARTTTAGLRRHASTSVVPSTEGGHRDPVTRVRKSVPSLPLGNALHLTDNRHGADGDEEGTEEADYDRSGDFSITSPLLATASRTLPSAPASRDSFVITLSGSTTRKGSITSPTLTNQPPAAAGAVTPPHGPSSAASVRGGASTSTQGISHPHRDLTVITVADSPPTSPPPPSPPSETAYLKSRDWWLGMILMVSGEVGNFMAYGFAPASVVAPLGTVTLITNVFLAPLVLKETVRARDAWGVVLAILGAMVVVSSSKSTEVTLTPDMLWEAISSFTAGLYYLVTAVSMVVLALVSPRWGPRFILIDISLVALFGGYTVLATKAVSSLLQLELILMFRYPITYLLIAVLLYSAILQIKYLNRALQFFDSTQVIPTQFVLFTLSAIVGSAVIYRDFEDVSLRNVAAFVSGCLLTFTGVFLITSNRSTRPHASVGVTAAVAEGEVDLDDSPVHAYHGATFGTANHGGLPADPHELHRYRFPNATPTAPPSEISSSADPTRHHHLVSPSASHPPLPRSPPPPDSTDPLWSYLHKNTSALRQADGESSAGGHRRRRSIAESLSESVGAPNLPQALRTRYAEVAQRLRSNSRSIIDHASQLHGVLNPTYMAVASTNLPDYRDYGPSGPAPSQSPRSPHHNYRTFSASNGGGGGEVRPAPPYPFPAPPRHHSLHPARHSGPYQQHRQLSRHSSHHVRPATLAEDSPVGAIPIPTADDPTDDGADGKSATTTDHGDSPRPPRPWSSLFDPIRSLRGQMSVSTGHPTSHGGPSDHRLIFPVPTSPDLVEGREEIEGETGYRDRRVSLRTLATSPSKGDRYRSEGDGDADREDV
ncbi:hypothetical protein IWQ60_009222 [Tieghemiomyces parasiticus]|uniref:Uncharacterized protein n=1 Tax=Tieghemiomyces parasiticus TaxID=78921 RepID=A0A9W8DQH2_9FUNG|nr:hypothetical protein IWQ60_009222 [Tieghemiomyces parasiticus]